MMSHFQSSFWSQNIAISWWPVRKANDAWLKRHFFEFHIFEYNYFAEVIWYQNMNSKNDEPLSELLLGSKCSHFLMTSSEDYVAWLSRHFFEFHILEYGYCAEVILYQNVNSKNDEPLSDLLLGSKYSHFLMTSSEGYVAWLNKYFFEFHIFEYDYLAEVILYQNMN